MRVATKIYSFP